MKLEALVERYAGLEKRGVLFYRGLAERFHGHPDAARLWRELSNTEASHFALLGLAQDWVAMAGGGEAPGAIADETLEAAAAPVTELEDAAARPGTTLQEALELSIRWEEIELPRVLDLVSHLPAKARGHVLAGMIAEAPEHYRMLSELAQAAGSPAQVERVAALTHRCRAALG